MVYRLYAARLTASCTDVVLCVIAGLVPKATVIMMQHGGFIQSNNVNHHFSLVCHHMGLSYRNAHANFEDIMYDNMILSYQSKTYRPSFIKEGKEFHSSEQRQTVTR